MANCYLCDYKKSGILRGPRIEALPVEACENRCSGRVATMVLTGSELTDYRVSLRQP